MTIVDRLTATRDAIDRAARDCGRDPAGVALVCVTKTFPGEDVVPLLEAGQRVFGENRVQEARGKWPPLRERYLDIELHLIGPLQSNKAREAVETFDVIESVDREKIARRWPRRWRGKASIRACSCRSTLATSRKRPACRPRGRRLPRGVRDKYGLKIDGLMCVPPVDQQVSPHFMLLADIAARNGLSALSMG